MENIEQAMIGTLKQFDSELQRYVDKIAALEAANASLEADVEYLQQQLDAKGVDGARHAMGELDKVVDTFNRATYNMLND